MFKPTGMTRTVHNSFRWLHVDGLHLGSVLFTLEGCKKDLKRERCVNELLLNSLQYPHTEKNTMVFQGREGESKYRPLEIKGGEIVFVKWTNDSCPAFRASHTLSEMGSQTQKLQIPEFTPNIS